MGNSNFISRNKCPACRSSNLKEIYQSPYDKPPISDYLKSFYSSQGGIEFEYLTDAVYRLSECADCRLIFQNEIPNDATMKLLYEKWIDSGKKFLERQETDGLMMYSGYAQEISTIIDFLGKVPSKLDFFDFGMGWGKWSLMAKGFGCNAYGTELSEERIKYAESNGIKVISWDDIARQKFDLINTEQVFEHIPNPLDTLYHIKEGLKDDGILKISVPTANNIDRRLKLMDWTAQKGSKYSLNAIAPLEHINYFRRSSILTMANKAGMEEVVIPMMTQYIHTTYWKGIKKIAKNILIPVYRNVLKKQNYMFFRKI